MSDKSSHNRMWVLEGRDSARIVIAVGLFFFGVYLWKSVFLSETLGAMDWPKELYYLSALRQAFLDTTVPFHTNLLLQNTNRFLANPEINLSPQVVLLRFLSPNSFVLFNVLFMLFVGLIGGVKVSKELDLSPATTAIYLTLVSFNGYIVSRIAVGHFMWCSCFLFTWFTLYVLRTMKAPNRLNVLKLSSVLFFVLVQGGLHQFVWLVIFLAVAAIWIRGDVGGRLAQTIVLSGGLGIFRFVPAGYQFWNLKHPFATGFPDLGTFFHSLLSNRDSTYIVVERWGWWEFDFYIGLPGFVFLTFALLSRFRRPIYGELNVPMFFLIIASFGSLYGWLSELPIPLVSVERMPSRFLIVPLFIVIPLGCAALDNILKTRGKASLALWPLLGWELWLLAEHSKHWYLVQLQKVWGIEKTFEAKLLDIVDEPYKTIVLVSWSISALVWAWTIFQFYKQTQKSSSQVSSTSTTESP